MFKDVINVTKLKNYNTKLAELEGKDAIQLLHRASEVKVIITQSYFFTLLHAYERYLEKKPNPVGSSMEEAMAVFEKLQRVANDDMESTEDVKAYEKKVAIQGRRK